MVRLYFVFFFISTFSYSKIEQIKLENTQINFDQLKGEAQIEGLSFIRPPTTWKSTNPFTIGISLINQNLELFFHELNFHYDHLPAQILGLKNFLIKGLNINIDSNVIQTSFSHYFQATQNGQYILGQTSLNCPKPNNTDQILIFRVLYSCLNEGEFVVENFDYLERNSKDFSPNHLQNIKLSLFDHKFQLTGLIKDDISIKFKLRGNIDLLQNSKYLQVHIKSAELNRVDVLDLLFDELKKRESEHFKVIRPYLFLYF